MEPLATPPSPRGIAPRHAPGRTRGAVPSPFGIGLRRGSGAVAVAFLLWVGLRPGFRAPGLALLMLAVTAVLLWQRHGAARRPPPAGAPAPDAAPDTRADAHDALTGLASRRGFEQRLPGLALELCGDDQLAVLVLDIYRFGRINAQWGRADGDRILQQLAQRLNLLDGVAALARVGADSMALAFVGTTADGVHALIERVLAVMRQPFAVGEGKTRQLTAALGCALYPLDCDDASRLLGMAEAAVFDQDERRLEVATEAIDPYGDAAASRLHWARRFLVRRIDRLVDDFLRRLRQHGDELALATPLGPPDTPDQRAALRRHIHELLSPELTREAHRARATTQGRLQAAIGLPARSTIRASGWLYRTFASFSQRIPGRLCEREILLALLMRRLECDMAFQQEGADTLMRELHVAVRGLSTDLRGFSRRVDIVEATVASLARLPFVLNCSFYSLSADGLLMLQATAGSVDLPASARPGGAACPPCLDASCASGSIEDGDEGEPGATAGEPTADGGPVVRSRVALPLVDGSGRVMAVIDLGGRLRGQFRTGMMRNALESLRVLVARAYSEAGHGRTAPAIPSDERSERRRRLFDGGLEMHMQPIIDFRAGRCTKVEALARLRMDDGRLLPPSDFLPLLRLSELDRLFLDGLDLALGSLAAWDLEGLHLALSFNLPPSTLRNPRCAAWVASALDRRGMAPSRLTLELLEDQELAADEVVQRQTAVLKSMGVHLALDDLGSGYGSLIRLRNLPFDLVKIDQALVRGVAANNSRGVPLVVGLVDLARRLGVEVAIEGLETHVLVEFAQFLEVEYGQGYGIARPMPAQAVAGWVREYRLSRFSGISPFDLS